MGSTKQRANASARRLRAHSKQARMIRARGGALCAVVVAGLALGCAESLPEPAQPEAPAPRASDPEPTPQPEPPPEPEPEAKAQGEEPKGPAARSPRKPKRLPEGEAPPPPPSEYDGPAVSKRRVVKKPDGSCVLVRDCSPSCGGEVPVQCPGE